MDREASWRIIEEQRLAIADMLSGLSPNSGGRPPVHRLERARGRRPRGPHPDSARIPAHAVHRAPRPRQLQPLHRHHHPPLRRGPRLRSGRRAAHPRRLTRPAQAHQLPEHPLRHHGARPGHGNPLGHTITVSPKPPLPPPTARWRSAGRSGTATASTACDCAPPIPPGSTATDSRSTARRWPYCS